MKNSKIINIIKSKLFNINDEYNLQNNTNNNINNIENMDFIINGIYQSNDENEVIEVIGESEYNNVFNVMIISSKNRQKNIEPIMMAEPELLKNYTFVKEKNDGIFKKFGGNSESAKRVVKLSNTIEQKPSIPDNKLLDEEALITELNQDEIKPIKPIEQPQQLFDRTQNKPQIKPTCYENRDNFNNALVDKIISKNNSKQHSFNINLNTNLDIENILKAIEYIDLDIKDFMNVLFQNHEFISSIKKSLIDSFINADYIKGEVTDLQPILDDKYNSKLDTIIDTINDIKTEVLATKEFNIEWSNMIHSTSEKNHLKLIELTDKIGDNIIITQDLNHIQNYENVSTNHSDFVDESVNNFDEIDSVRDNELIETEQLIAEEIKEKYNVLSDETIERINNNYKEIKPSETPKVDYNDVVDSFINRHLKR